MVGDLRGLFFELSRDDDQFLVSLRATGADVTAQVYMKDGVADLGQGVNVNGDVVKETGKFDASVEIGYSGLRGGADNIQWTHFTRSSSLCLTLDMVQSIDTALRATSVGDRFVGEPPADRKSGAVRTAGLGRRSARSSRRPAPAVA